MSSSIRSFASLNARQRPTIGDTKTNAITADHMGWLLCDGRELNTSDYAQLFNIIGNSFGGDGVTTFKLPDPEGRVLGIVGQAQTNGTTDPFTVDHPLGDVSGEEFHLLLLPEIPAHNHNFATGAPGVTSTAVGITDVSGNHDHGGSTGTAGSAAESETVQGGLGASVAGANSHSHSIPTGGNHSHQIASNGGSQRHNNIQPTMWIGNLFIYGGRQWVAATPQSRAIQGPNPVPNSNYYRPQGPPTNLY